MLRFLFPVLALSLLTACGGGSSSPTGPSATAPAVDAAEASQPPPTPSAASTPTDTTLDAKRRGGAPVIKQWVAVRNRTTVLLALDLYDADADMLGGSANIRIKGQPGLSQALSSGPITRLVPGTIIGPEMDLALGIYSPTGIPRGIPIAFTVSVRDRAGHKSNTVSGFFVTEDKAGTADEPDGPAPQFQLQTVELGPRAR